MSTDPLTPEQVARLRLPEGFSLVKSVLADGMWLTAWARNVDRTRACIAHAACGVANGHLPPEAIDAVWAVVEGKSSREAELLRAVTETHTAAVKASAAARAARCDDMEWAQRDADEQEAGEEFRSAMAAAREWIEEQEP
jgi:hypothetical protein